MAESKTEDLGGPVGPWRGTLPLAASGIAVVSFVALAGPRLDVGGHPVPGLRRRPARRVPRWPDPRPGLRRADAAGLAADDRQPRPRGGHGRTRGLRRGDGGATGARARPDDQEPVRHRDRLALVLWDRPAAPELARRRGRQKSGRRAKIRVARAAGRPAQDGQSQDGQNQDGSRRTQGPGRQAGGQGRDTKPGTRRPRLRGVQKPELDPVGCGQRARTGRRRDHRAVQRARQRAGDRVPRPVLRRRSRQLPRRRAALRPAEEARSLGEGARRRRRDPAALAVRPAHHHDRDLPVHLGRPRLPRHRRFADPRPPGGPARLRADRRPARRRRDHPAGEPRLRGARAARRARRLSRGASAWRATG